MLIHIAIYFPPPPPTLDGMPQDKFAAMRNSDIFRNTQFDEGQ